VAGGLTGDDEKVSNSSCSYEGEAMNKALVNEGERRYQGTHEAWSGTWEGLDELDVRNNETRKTLQRLTWQFQVIQRH
jgi:hypothetical protein